jgi:type I restriction enzyme R subunit
VLLTRDEQKELDDGGEVSGEDVLAAQMAARADDRSITFVAFTATPKSRTLELFGTRPDPTRKPAPDNVPSPFDVYSMRQAIDGRVHPRRSPELHPVQGRVPAGT